MFKGKILLFFLSWATTVFPFPQKIKLKLDLFPQKFAKSPQNNKKKKKTFAKNSNM